MDSRSFIVGSYKAVIPSAGFIMDSSVQGFSILSAPHMAILAAIVLACICAALFYRKIPERTQNIIGMCSGILIALIDISHYIVYYFLGELNVFSIPLHLCALAVYVCLLHSIFRSDWMGQVLYALCLPGVWCALLFPNWTIYPIFSYESLDSFVIHGLIAVYITSQIAAGRIRPRLSYIWKPVLFLCAVVPVAAAANLLLVTNFMFISYASPGSPLEWLEMLAGGSHALYLIYFAILALAVMTVLYLPFSIHNRRRKADSRR